MSETADKTVRLSKVAREFNQGLHTVVEFLASKGHKVEQNPNTKIGADLYDLLMAEFGTDKAEKEASKQTIQARQERESVILHSGTKEAPRKPATTPAPAPTPVPPPAAAPVEAAAPTPAAAEPVPAPVTAPPANPPVATADTDVIKAKADKVEGPKTLGKIDLDAPRKGAKKTAKAEPEPPAPPPPAPVAAAPPAP
ncbi:MAG: hypothetical protein JNM91_03520, partial [Flavobacteriales bacterium]|nr:hypothetical protein [Flavobacteriales bacterium]